MSCSYKNRLRILKAARKELLDRIRRGLDAQPYIAEIEERIDYYTKLSKKTKLWP